MNNIVIDNNSRAVQISELSICKNLIQGEKLNVKGIIRVKNIDSVMAIINYSDEGGDGMYLSPDETEYIFINREIIVIQGIVNIMF